jgi:radical SAM superfamily enzyme
MLMERLYYKFSDYLKEKYGEKVYKLPVNLPVSCPNRDGRLSRNGCIFCGEEGAGFENLPDHLGVKEQLSQNSRYIGQHYKAGKFIAYFQNYTNTYMKLEQFKKYISEQNYLFKRKLMIILVQPDVNVYIENKRRYYS